MPHRHPCVGVSPFCGGQTMQRAVMPETCRMPKASPSGNSKRNHIGFVHTGGLGRLGVQELALAVDGAEYRAVARGTIDVHVEYRQEDPDDDGRLSVGRLMGIDMFDCTDDAVGGRESIVPSGRSRGMRRMGSRKNPATTNQPKATAPRMIHAGSGLTRPAKAAFATTSSDGGCDLARPAPIHEIRIRSTACNASRRCYSEALPMNMPPRMAMIATAARPPVQIQRFSAMLTARPGQPTESADGDDQQARRGDHATGGSSRQSTARPVVASFPWPHTERPPWEQPERPLHHRRRLQQPRFHRDRLLQTGPEALGRDVELVVITAVDLFKFGSEGGVIGFTSEVQQPRTRSDRFEGQIIVLDAVADSSCAGIVIGGHVDARIECRQSSRARCRRDPCRCHR